MKKNIILLLAALAFNVQSFSQVSSLKAPQERHSFTGYFNITDVGLLIGSPENAHVAPFSFMTINGWHLSEQLSAGLGLGVEFLSGSYMPIFLDLRYYVRNSSFSPFFMLDCGYSLALDDDYSNVNRYFSTMPWNGNYTFTNYKAQGGWLINPGFGIRNMFSENFGVIFSVGYRNQRLFYKAADDHRLLADYNRLVLKIGILFR